MADRTLFCAICSGPIRPLAPGPGQEWSAALKWQTKLILLSDPDREFETLEQHYKAGKRPKIPKLAFQAQADIRRDVAVVRDGEWCVLQDADGTEIKPNWSMEVDENNRVYSMPYSIAAHGACVDIVVRLMRSSRNEVHVRSMRTLWKVLRMGFDARDNEYMGSVDAAGPQYIVMDNGHYMPVGFVTAPGAWNGDDEHWVRLLIPPTA
ncbi:uncharacterized protein BCR38DRAFT_128255 [Pseudomassariella vexata]|uniref:Uncharacterized protein n=1 Tax=Pseudomassariella vexata TaxID=1141098 RepID=A0A1Y2EAB9_9PEZI|nr:uncharacterized protein BCR38DRAFT_128255 [Pseudomassariella vexata]ORY68196.1 hypothetical protein BCR38DRAFT_128255 [Pseudomassariella vexata]